MSDSGRFDPDPRIPYRMSSFVSRGAVLASARLLNQALALLSPLLLVRLLEISEYGRYRQFMATAMFITSLAGFALSANLNYLIARSPERQAIDITNTCLLMLAVSVVSALVIVIARQWIVPPEISSAWPLLAVYVFLFLNLEVLVSYWLAHRQSFQVMAYTLAMTVWRIATLLAATFWLHDVELIFVTIVCAEALKNLWIYVWLRRRGLLVFRWDAAAMREQVRLVAPLGAGSVLYKANDFGKVVVANQMGPVPLAIYTTAAYQVPLVNIVQGALADVIFPDMVKRSRTDPSQGLLLWKRAQVLMFAAICPAWLLITYFAEPLVRLLFTEAYVAATPYFQVFLLLMVRQCFQFSTPLRSVEDNASFAHANLVALDHQRGSDHHPHAGIWPLGPHSGSDRRPDLDVHLPGIARAQALPAAAVGTVPVGQARARARRRRWSRSRRCMPRSCICRARSPESPPASRPSRWSTPSPHA